ncbi:MAG: hypothetical protein AAF198_02285 [Pseudomonadota bacterium]
MVDTEVDYELDLNEIEMKARQLRAETLAYGWSKMIGAMKSLAAKNLLPANLGARKPA